MKCLLFCNQYSSPLAPPAPRAPIFHGGENLLLVWGVRDSIAGVEFARVVHVLSIALTEVKTRLESLCEEVNSVECFGFGCEELLRWFFIIEAA